jgi:hypothetical protein
MNQVFQLSGLSKARLKRHNRFSLACIVMAVALAFLAANAWFVIGAAYFLAKFFYRWKILHNKAPYLHATDDGLTVCWFRSTFIKWDTLIEVHDASKDVITIKYQRPRDGKNVSMLILKWRIEADPVVLIELLKANMSKR